MVLYCPSSLYTILDYNISHVSLDCFVLDYILYIYIHILIFRYPSNKTHLILQIICDQVVQSGPMLTKVVQIWPNGIQYSNRSFIVNMHCIFLQRVIDLGPLSLLDSVLSWQSKNEDILLKVVQIEPEWSKLDHFGPQLATLDYIGEKIE